MEEKPCPTCGGSGFVLDDKLVGEEMRRLREAEGMTCRELARRLNLSAAYVCDLELGRRKWRAELVRKFKEILM